MRVLRLTPVLKITLGVLLLTGSVSSEGKYAYTERGKNRWEGVKKVPSSSLDLRIVSFLAYRENFNFASEQNIKVKLYVPSKESVFITASEIVPVRNYYMKPLKNTWGAGWQLFSDWPAADVLIPLQIEPAQLGLVGRISQDKPGSGKLVPLLFYVNDHPKQIDSYEVCLTSRETLSVVRYTLWAEGSEEGILRKVVRKKFPASTPILIKLNLKGQPAGLFRLSVKGKVKGLNEGPRRTYIFFHKPEVTK
jgi:hypothetical protein